MRELYVRVERALGVTIEVFATAMPPAVAEERARNAVQGLAGIEAGDPETIADVIAAVAYGARHERYGGLVITEAQARALGEEVERLLTQPR